MNRPYLIWSPPFDESSGGIKVMHRMVVELQKRGCEVFLNTKQQNPKWDYVPFWEDCSEPDVIAIYPEIVPGNPFNAKTVVRYLLNIPGACAPDYRSTWGYDDILYTYSKLFNTKLNLPEDRVILCPHIDLDVFYDMELLRKGRMVYRGKGRQPDIPMLKDYPSLGGKESFRGDDGQQRLAESLNRCDLLYCYDTATAMTEIARLCGCPVVLLPDCTYTWQDYQQHEFWQSGGIGFDLLEAPLARLTINSDVMRADYQEAEKIFQKKLTEFIEVTQNG